MALIRADHAVIQPLRFSLRDFADEAERIVESAAIEAQAILASARRQAETIESDSSERARAKGFDEGYAQGQALGRQEALDGYGQELAMAARALAQLNDAVESTCVRLESQAISDVARLAIAIAERVTHRLGMIDPKVLRANLSDAVKLAMRGQNVRIAVNPRQREIIEEALGQIEVDIRSSEKCAVVEDETIAPGGCRILTRDGQIDATLKTQLDILTELLLPASIHGQTGNLFSS